MSRDWPDGRRETDEEVCKKRNGLKRVLVMQPRERGIFHGLKHGFDDQATDRICSARNHCEKEGDCVPLVPFFFVKILSVTNVYKSSVLIHEWHSEP